MLQRIKHINVRFHYTKDMMRQGEVDVVWIQTEKQKADLGTKGLGRIQHELLTVKVLNLIDA